MLSRAIEFFLLFNFSILLLDFEEMVFGEMELLILG